MYKNKKTVLVMFLLIYFVFFSFDAFAAPIQDLPYLMDLNPVFGYSPDTTVRGGPQQAELKAHPDSLLNIPLAGIGTGIYGGLSGTNGDLGSGDEYFTLLLQKSGKTYWLDSVELCFNNGTSHWCEGAYAITATSGLVFASNNTISDLNKSLGLSDNQYVGIESGSIVFSFQSSAPIPLPTTLLLFGTGIVSLIGTRIRRKK
jgi:hypothetical protein